MHVVQLFEAGHTLRADAAALLCQLSLITLHLGGPELLHLSLQVLRVGLKAFDGLRQTGELKRKKKHAE